MSYNTKSTPSISFTVFIIVTGLCAGNTYINYYSVDDQCYDICPNKTYHDSINKKCVDCPKGCTSCSNSSYCTACETPTYILNSSNLCQQCQLGCVSCTSLTYCLKCASGYFLRNDHRCYTSCLPGFFPDLILNTC